MGQHMYLAEQGENGKVGFIGGTYGCIDGPFYAGETLKRFFDPGRKLLQFKPFIKNQVVFIKYGKFYKSIPYVYD
jgi:hypothetical protein